MSSFIFTQQRVRELRQHSDRLHAHLILASSNINNVSPDRRRVSHFYQEYMVHDHETGESLEKKKRKVQDQLPGEDARPALLTILMVERTEVFEDDPIDGYRAIDQDVAYACGFKSVQALRGWWLVHHPTLPLAKIAWFRLGDLRDRDLYLRRYVSRGGDYTAVFADDIIDPLPVLSQAQLRQLARNNNQRDVKRRIEQEQKQQEYTLAERLAAIQSAPANILKDLQHELDIITIRTARGIRKLQSS